MRVVFLEDVPRVGRAGEVKEVADGYGRNFLLPRKLALLATPATLKSTEAQRQAAVLRQERSEAELRELAQQHEGLPLTIKAKVGAKDQLYGSIRTFHIAEEISRITGFDIDRKSVELKEPIRQLGSYDIPVKLAKDITFVVKVIVEEDKD